MRLFGNRNTKIVAAREHSTLVQAEHAELSVISSAVDLLPPTDDFLLDLFICAADKARKIDLSWIEQRCSNPAQSKYVQQWPGEHYRLLSALVQCTNAKKVVEVGTHIGLGALSLMAKDASVITYDIVPWDEFPDTALLTDDFENGLEQRIGDLSDRRYFKTQISALAEAEILFIDGPKDGIFEPKLAEYLVGEFAGSGKFVVWDDIRVMTMVDAWRRIPVAKLDATSIGHWSGTGFMHFT
jgi:hypothetical protein